MHLLFNSTLRSYHIIVCHILSYHTTSNHTASNHVISYYIVSYHIIISNQIISCHIVSCYQIKSYHVTSYHITAPYIRANEITYLIGRLGEGLLVRTMFSTYCLTISVLEASISAIAPSVSTMFPLLCKL